MNTFAIFRRFVLCACLAHGSASVQAANTQAEIAGHVAFINGPVQLLGSDKQTRSVQTGDPVYVGDQIQTQANAHLHLRMVDNAFVALRPESQLVIRTYTYDKDQPQASRIRLDLQQGTSRAVTGKGGQAAKHQYRFNTPLAAIGLRGTDYTVTSQAEKTSVAVAQGGVIVSPFGDGCQAAQLGPCQTPFTRELTADMRNTFMEVTPNQAPRLLQTNVAPTATRRQTPPAAVDELPDSSTSRQTIDQVAAANKQTLTEPQVNVDVVSNRADTFARWGRWSALAQQLPAGSGTINQVFSQMGDYQIVTSNEAFALAFPTQTAINLPDQGKVKFELIAAEAYLKDGPHSTAIGVKSGQLEMDFGLKTFKTELALRTTVPGAQTVQAQGVVNAFGGMQSNGTPSDTQLQGIVLNKGKEAAYLFEKTLRSGALLSGATQWLR
jgi:hypothetical protein